MFLTRLNEKKLWDEIASSKAPLFLQIMTLDIKIFLFYRINFLTTKSSSQNISITLALTDSSLTSLTVFLLNTRCSPEASFRAPTYHDLADSARSWDRRTEYFGQQLSPYRPFWTSHRCANRDFGANISSSLCLQWTKSRCGNCGPFCSVCEPLKTYLSG